MDTSESIAALSLIISIATCFIYFKSYADTQKLSITTLNRAHRPYVFARTYAKEVNGDLQPLINQVIFNVYNAPALIKKRKIIIIERFKDKPDVIIFEQPDGGMGFIYPSDGIRTITIIDDTYFNQEMMVKSTNTFIRKIEIEYTWIAKSAEIYTFKSEDYYNVHFKNWVLLSEKAT